MRLCALMEQTGPEEEEIIMGLGSFRKSSRAAKRSSRAMSSFRKRMRSLPIFRRRLFGQNRERYIDPNQVDLLPDSMTPALSQVKPKPEERPRKKPRILFTPERIKGLPVKVIEIDPEGDLSSLKKIGAEDHYVLDYRPARLRILCYARNQCVDPTPKIVAHRAWRKSQQTGHFPLAGLLTVIVAKEGSDVVHRNSGSRHGSWEWLIP